MSRFIRTIDNKCTKWDRLLYKTTSCIVSTLLTVCFTRFCRRYSDFFDNVERNVRIAILQVGFIKQNWTILNAKHYQHLKITIGHVSISLNVMKDNCVHMIVIMA
jgi:hypothetical protein